MSFFILAKLLVVPDQEAFKKFLYEKRDIVGYRVYAHELVNFLLG